MSEQEATKEAKMTAHLSPLGSIRLEISKIVAAFHKWEEKRNIEEFVEATEELASAVPCPPYPEKGTLEFGELTVRLVNDNEWQEASCRYLAVKANPGQYSVEDFQLLLRELKAECELRRRLIWEEMCRPKH